MDLNLFVDCGTCHGSGLLANWRDECGACYGDGVVPIEWPEQDDDEYETEEED